MSPRERKAADPRHSMFRTLLEAYWRDEKNDLVPELPWGPGEAGVLGAFLAANPTISASGFSRLLANRLASEDHAAGEAPRVWLSSLTRYANGPLDRFKLLKQVKSSEATVGMTKQDKPGDDSDAMSYWRIVKSNMPTKYARECPPKFKAKIDAEVQQ